MVNRLYPGPQPAVAQRGQRETRDAYVPVDAPLPFEYRGKKGSLQLFAQARPSSTSLARARVEARDLFAIPGGMRLLSVPGQQLPVNPQGWTHQSAWAKGLADRWILYSNSDKMRTFFDDLDRCAALDGLRTVIDVTSVGVTLTPHVVEVDTLVLSEGQATADHLMAKFNELLDVLPRLDPAAHGIIDPSPHPGLALQLASCEICQHPLDFPVALCEGCVTPHHLDCWRYNQQCSTYACRRTAYILIQDRAELEAHLAGSHSRPRSL